MVERRVLALIVLAPALAHAGVTTVSAQDDRDSRPPSTTAPGPAGADAQAAPTPQAAPPDAAIPLAPPSMTAPRDSATSQPASSSHWYGWQILLGDAAVFSFAGLTQNASIAYGWVGSGAVVHFGHGNVGRGIGSALLRVSLPIVGLLAGEASAKGCHGDWCDAGAVFGGGLIGMGTAELIDVVLLANDSAPTPAAVRAARHSDGVQVSPVVRAGRSGFGLDVVGRF